MNARRTTIYIGVTGDLERRMFQRKNKEIMGYTRRYNVTDLVYFEGYSSAQAAISREKQLKGWKRDKKLELVKGYNPKMLDLSNNRSLSA